MADDLPESARRVQQALTAAGTPRAVFSVNPHELVRAIGARVVPVTTSRQHP